MEYFKMYTKLKIGYRFVQCGNFYKFKGEVFLAR